MAAELELRDTQTGAIVRVPNFGKPRTELRCLLLSLADRFSEAIRTLDLVYGDILCPLL